MRDWTSVLSLLYFTHCLMARWFSLVEGKTMHKISKTFHNAIKTAQVIGGILAMMILWKTGITFGWTVTWYLITEYIRMVAFVAAVLCVDGLLRWYYTTNED